MEESIVFPQIFLVADNGAREVGNKKNNADLSRLPPNKCQDATIKGKEIIIEHL
jgi:hypothetical protein